MSNFNDVQYAPLRTFNRVQVACNLRADTGMAYAEDYINQFTREEKNEMNIMLGLIRKVGWEQARKLVNKNLPLSGETYAST